MQRILSNRANGQLQHALAQHWPEYLIEAGALGLFMISAAAFTALLEHPQSWLHQCIHDRALRRFLIGVAMGVTAIGIIYSPWGKRSGAHINPAATITFFQLGKIAPWDAFFYIAAQFLGATVGMTLALLILTQAIIAHPSVHYVVTVPGEAGASTAFVAEMLLSCGLMLLVLVISNRRDWNRYTGLLVGFLVMVYISVEAPLSGMSMNPARSFGSALLAQDWRSFAIYLVAPPVGMLLAAQIYLRLPGYNKVLCCKLHHENDEKCIFHCHYHDQS
jgi:aquaporin Z